jgi:hypothetical protein
MKLRAVGKCASMPVCGGSLFQTHNVFPIPTARLIFSYHWQLGSYMPITVQGRAVPLKDGGVGWIFLQTSAPHPFKGDLSIDTTFCWYGSSRWTVPSKASISLDLYVLLCQ